MKEETLKTEMRNIGFMKPQKLKISDGCQKPARFMKPGKTNQEDRLNFIKFWANYIKTHSDKDWSSQQNIIINSQIVNSSKNKKK